MESEVSQLIFDRFLADLERVAPDEAALLAALQRLKETGDLEREAALIETYRELAAQ